MLSKAKYLPVNEETLRFTQGDNFFGGTSFPIITLWDHANTTPLLPAIVKISLPSKALELVG